MSSSSNNRQGNEGAGGVSRVVEERILSQIETRKAENRARLEEVNRLENDMKNAVKRVLTDPRLSSMSSQFHTKLLQSEREFLEMERAHLRALEAMRATPETSVVSPLHSWDTSKGTANSSAAASNATLDPASKARPQRPLGAGGPEALKLNMNFDGASKSNPGEAGAGWLLTRGDGSTLAYGWKYLGSSMTNNEAEYAGFMEGLKYIASGNVIFTELNVRGDSNLVVEQVSGNWKCKSPNLIPLCREAQDIVARLRQKGTVNLTHVRREQNTLADTLSNIAVARRTIYVNEEVAGKDVAQLLKSH